jgi:hypothetical protein
VGSTGSGRGVSRGWIGPGSPVGHARALSVLAVFVGTVPEVRVQRPNQCEYTLIGPATGGYKGLEST